MDLGDEEGAGEGVRDGGGERGGGMLTGPCRCPQWCRDSLKLSGGLSRTILQNSVYACTPASITAVNHWEKGMEAGNVPCSAT